MMDSKAWKNIQAYTWWPGGLTAPWSLVRSHFQVLCGILSSPCVCVWIPPCLWVNLLKKLNLGVHGHGVLWWTGILSRVYSCLTHSVPSIGVASGPTVYHPNDSNIQNAHYVRRLVRLSATINDWLTFLGTPADGHIYANWLSLG